MCARSGASVVRSEVGALRGSSTWRVIGAAATAVLVAIAPVLEGSSGALGASMQPGTGLSTNYDFAALVLRDGGWPVSASNVTVLTQWLRAEEPTSHWWNRDNPLNNGLGSGGGSGLGSYDSVVTAAYDIARNLENAAYGYPLITRDLAASAPAIDTAMAIWRSSWASGHYGRGADWGTSPVPSVPSPPAVWRNQAACPVPYPPGEVGPCGRWFSTTGSTWHTGAPEGVERQELWAFSGSQAADTASWAPRLGAGRYTVAAYLPALFDDATVTYVVADATGTHPIHLDQEPYSDAWVTFGTFEATAAVGIAVTLTSTPSGPGGATYVGADAVRFTLVAQHAHSAQMLRAQEDVRRVTRPDAPLDVSAVAGNHSAVVSWLPPPKHGGSPVTRFWVLAHPGGRTCAAASGHGEDACTVSGLVNGVSYTFTVRAVNHGGVGVASTASSPVRPLGVPSLRLVATASGLHYGDRIILRASPSSARTMGSVLFALDGGVLHGCQSSRVIRGWAACSMRIWSTARHVVLATYSGDSVLSGSEHALTLVFARAPSSFRIAASPVKVAPKAALSLRAWHLPGRATGKIVFTAGAVRLCVAAAHSGGATCATTVTLAGGVHLVVANYLGDRDYLGSLARVRIQVLTS